MRRALQLAARARGRTAPNPMVGAVLVQGDECVGEGYHHRAGEPHAEVMALREAVDFFKLWTVGLLGLGFAAVTGMRRGWALLVVFVLYAMYVGVFMIGLPGMTAGGGR